MHTTVVVQRMSLIWRMIVIASRVCPIDGVSNFAKMS